MKKFSIVATTLLLSSSLFAGTCSDGLKYDFTFFGSPTKSYVVTKNTFKKAKADFPSEKLLNATLSIDAFSIDTSADLSNGKTAKWPPAMATIRNNNTINNFFKKFEKDVGKIDVKIVKVTDSNIDVQFKMNGVTKVSTFDYKIENGVIKASGKLDVLNFNTQKAWTQFSVVCKGFHQGKSWSEIDVFFEVPASCK